MGLDSYMSVKRCVYLKDDKRTVDLDKIDNRSFDYIKRDEFGISNRIEITEQVAYWRNADCIHKWFVDNCTGGEDDCKPVYVNEDKLRDLYGICKGVIELMDGTVCAKTKSYSDKNGSNKNGKDYVELFRFDKNDLECMMKKDLCEYTFYNEKVRDFCEEKFSTTNGFFFGSTDYDCGYIYDLIKTILMFDKLFLKLEEYKKNKVWYGIEYCASW